MGIYTRWLQQVVQNEIQNLLRLYLFFQLKNSNSLAFFIILLSCLYYFKWSNKKNRTFDISCIVKWGSKIDKITFWSVKS